MSAPASVGKRRLGELVAEYWPRAVELGRAELEHLPLLARPVVAAMGGPDGIERAAQRLVAQAFEQVPDDDAVIDAWLERAAARLLAARSSGRDATDDAPIVELVAHDATDDDPIVELVAHDATDDDPRL